MARARKSGDKANFSRSLSRSESLPRGVGRRNNRIYAWAAGATCAGAALAAPSEARAQQHTFHLDRLEMPGAPDDGVVLFRPTQNAKNIFFAQLGLGFSLDPLHTRNITDDRSTINRSNAAVISTQFTQYSTVGFEFLDRFTVAATLPVTWVQTGENPNYGASTLLGSSATTTVSTGGPSVSDLRLDLRGTILRSADRKAAFGAQLSLFAPTGNGSASNFGGDGQTSAMLMITGEYTWKFVTFVGNTGIDFRPKNSINDPVNGSGLGIGNEWRWAAGAFIPIKQKFRVGATIFGQTGIESDSTTIGSTAFTTRNTPIEWNAEGRMKFGPKDQWWTGASVGTLISRGYGAPDLRVVALVGTYLPILDSDARSPEIKTRDDNHRRWNAEHTRDSDHDGIPDDVDACPNEAEDRLGADPNDGCPLPPDRDGDGIPDQYDKCPDQPEDKDGIEDGDGCPEDDYDADGVPDTQDACPKAPGQASTDPKKNGCPTSISYEGGVIRILQQVHFKTGSSEILPDSFPMLQEIANLLKANPSIKKIAVEGHTDNRGAAAMNLTLSQGRAESVMKWMTDHGLEAGRVEAHGYGVTRPIDSNATDKGRAANRRVEFKILDEADTNQSAAPKKKKSDDD